MIRALPILVFAALCAWGGPLAAQAEKRVALVVGNAVYPEAPLKNPANGARAMAQALRARGFQAEKRLTLVVGNSAYPEAPLRNPAADARAMARVLRERGFERPAPASSSSASTRL